ANFKETQLTDMRPGQKATVKVDAYGGKKFTGHVDSIAAATRARFSLLPPENATGNYVKVVQRVPVKIVLDPGQDPEHLLRPGIAVFPTVHFKYAHVRRASPRQPVDRRHRGDVRDLHGGPGHDRRQRLAAAHRPPPVRDDRRIYLGAVLLP